MNGAELPEGWAETTVGAVAAKIANIKPENEPDRQFAYVDISSIDNQSNQITSTKSILGKDAPSRARRPVQPNDVLFSNVRTYLRNVAVVPRDVAADVCSTGFTVLRSNGAVEPKFLFRLTLTDDFVGLTEDTSTGTHYPATSDRAVMELPIPLPPLAEQRRIVAAVEGILGKVTAARDRLARVPATLKRFRQAVLAAACSGRLTADWREDNPSVEPASALLQRIAELRAQNGGRQRRSVSADERVPDDVELQSVDESELPGTWEACRIEQVANVCLGGTPSRKVAEYWGGSVPWVSSGEVANCRIRDTNEKLSESGIENSNAKLYPAGTVLIAMIGEGKTRGQSALLDIKASTNQNVAGLVFDAGNIVPEYVWHWALGVYERHRSGGRGGNYPALNGQIVRQFQIPLPPLPEQHEIVRRVSALFALADRIEAKVAAARKRVEGLTQAVLAKAFRGELVPTEAELARREGRDYEPAYKLLERIKAERLTPPPGPLPEAGRGRKIRRAPKR